MSMGKTTPSCPKHPRSLRLEIFKSAWYTGEGTGHQRSANRLPKKEGVHTRFVNLETSERDSRGMGKQPEGGRTRLSKQLFPT